VVHVIEELAGDWHRLDERIKSVSSEIEALADQDPSCERLMTVPGIGPIISSATVAAISNGAAFSKGRDFGAWLGLVPRLDRRPHNPRQDIEAGQSVPARPIRAGGPGRAASGLRSVTQKSGVAACGIGKRFLPK
jgi:Transposase IS116/IS110/IS902 family